MGSTQPTSQIELAHHRPALHAQPVSPVCASLKDACVCVCACACVCVRACACARACIWPLSSSKNRRPSGSRTLSNRAHRRRRRWPSALLSPHPLLTLLAPSPGYSGHVVAPLPSDVKELRGGGKALAPPPPPSPAPPAPPAAPVPPPCVTTCWALSRRSWPLASFLTLLPAPPDVCCACWSSTHAPRSESCTGGDMCTVSL